MATKWFTDRPVTRIHKCQECKEGKHQEAVIGEAPTHSDNLGACECFCTKLNRLPVNPAVPFPYRADTEAVLRLLRERGVQCRGSRGYKLLWKPTPEEMEPAVRMAIRSHKLELVHILFPWGDWNVPLRPYWYLGEGGPCIDPWCVPDMTISFVRSYDPLGQRRHASCGWLTGPPATTPA